MKLTQVLQFHESSVASLTRPWKTYRDGTLFYGQTKTGNKRLPLNTKQGNKNFYKGTRSSGIGHSDLKGKYTINYSKVRTFVAPALDTIATSKFKPLVSGNIPKPRGSFKGYSHGASDGRLLLDKIKEYVNTGDVKFPAIQDNIERG